MAASSENAKRNQKALSKMSPCERETGKTAQQLAQVQQGLRTDFYRRCS